MDALMYGVMLMASMENLLKAPPENKSSNPNKLPLLKRFSMTEASTPGTGIWTPSLKIINMIKVNTARFRNSGTFSTFWMLFNTLDHLNLTTGCFNFLLRRFREALSYDCQGFFQFAVTEDTNTVTNVFKDTCFN